MVMVISPGIAWSAGLAPVRRAKGAVTCRGVPTSALRLVSLSGGTRGLRVLVLVNLTSRHLPDCRTGLASMKSHATAHEQRQPGAPDRSVASRPCASFHPGAEYYPIL